MEQGTSTLTNYEQDSRYKAELTLGLLGLASATCTFLLLGTIKVVVYFCLTRRQSWGQRLAWDHCDRVHWMEEGEKGEAQVCRCQTFKMLPWYISTLVTDVIIYPTMLVFALYVLHSSTLVEFPLHHTHHGNAYTYGSCVVIGVLLYRLMLTIMTPGIMCKYRLSFVYTTAGLILYLSVAITQENAMLAVLGMIYQSHLLFQTSRRVCLHGSRRSVSLWTVNVSTVVCIILFSGILPLSYVCIALTRQSLLDLPYHSIAIFAFMLVFFAIAMLVNLVKALCVTCTDTVYSTDYEKQLLLVGKSSGDAKSTRTHNTFTTLRAVQLTPSTTVLPAEKLNGHLPAPGLAYPFKFPTLDTK